MKAKGVWVTGASSGIGAALARELVSRGAWVVLSAPPSHELEQVAEETGGHALPLDLTEPDTFDAAVEEAWDVLGGVDVMVHNAGVAHRDLVRNTGTDVDRRLMEINYLGPVHLTKLLLPRMLEQGHGQFGVMSSLSGKYGVPRTSAYAAAKHALHGFFETLRAEEAENGIDVTMLIPGFVNTEITRHALTGQGEEYGEMLRVQSEGITPEWCAERIADALESEREEVLIGSMEVLSVYVSRLWPWAWRRLIRNHPMRHIREAEEAVHRLFSAGESEEG